MLFFQIKYGVCHLLKLIIFWLYPRIFISTFYVIASDYKPLKCPAIGNWIVSLGTSLVVQWLRLFTSTAGVTGLVPGWGTNIPHAVQPRNLKKKKKKKKFLYTVEYYAVGKNEVGLCDMEVSPRYTIKSKKQASRQSV